MSPYIMIAFCVGSLVAGQVLFKIISGHMSSPMDLIRNRDALTLLGLALTLYATATIAWIFALRTLPLSHAYLFNALTFLLVPITAYFVLGETIEPRFFVGSFFILIGILIAST